MEIGAGQGAVVSELVASDGRWLGARLVHDHAGMERVVAVERRRDEWTRS